MKNLGLVLCLLCLPMLVQASDAERWHLRYGEAIGHEPDYQLLSLGKEKQKRVGGVGRFYVQHETFGQIEDTTLPLNLSERWLMRLSGRTQMPSNRMHIDIGLSAAYLDGTQNHRTQIGFHLGLGWHEGDWLRINGLMGFWPHWLSTRLSDIGMGFIEPSVGIILRPVSFVELGYRWRAYRTLDGGFDARTLFDTSYTFAGLYFPF